MAWLDTGTHIGLLEASNYVEAIQKRQGFYIACLEEISFNNGWIDEERVLKSAETLEKTEYCKYLIEIVSKSQI